MMRPLHFIGGQHIQHRIEIVHRDPRSESVHVYRIKQSQFPNFGEMTVKIFRMFDRTKLLVRSQIIIMFDVPPQPGESGNRLRNGQF